MPIEPVSALATSFAKALEPEAAKTTAKFTEKLFGPALDEWGSLLADSVRWRRFQKQVHTLKRANEMLQAAHIDPQPVLLKTLVPLLEGASLEEDESLQEKWAALLANAASGRMNAAQMPSFSQILKEVSSVEAEMLDAIFFAYNNRSERPAPPFAFWIDMKDIGKEEIILVDDEFELLKENLLRLGLLGGNSGAIQVLSDGKQVGNISNLSILGRYFMQACQSPLPST